MQFKSVVKVSYKGIRHIKMMYIFFTFRFLFCFSNEAEMRR